MGAENFSSNQGGRIYENDASQPIKTGITDPEREMGEIGIGSTLYNMV